MTSLRPAQDTNSRQKKRCQSGLKLLLQHRNPGPSRSEGVALGVPVFSLANIGDAWVSIVASEGWGRTGCPGTAVSQTLTRSRKKDSGLGATRKRPYSVLESASAHEKCLLILATAWSRTQSGAPLLIAPAIEKTLAVGHKGEDNLRTVASFSYIPRLAFRTSSVPCSFNILTNPVRN
jgi:hypothetical protein